MGVMLTVVASIARLVEAKLPRRILLLAFSGLLAGFALPARAVTPLSPIVAALFATVDVQPLNVVPGSSSVAPGGSLSVSWQIRNNGTGTAGTSNSQVRITTSNAANGYGTSANNVGSPQATGSIGPGATINQSTTVTVPSTAGTYYVWIVADNNSALTQTNTSNDYAVSSAVTVTSGSGTVDVQPLNVVPGSSSVAPGGSLSVSWQIRNNGTGTAGTSNSQVRITTSNAANGYGTSANNVGSPQATGSIGPGATINQSTTVTVPSTAGTYYVWIVADNNSALTQTNTSNDYAVSSAVTVTSGSGTVDVQPLNVVPGSSSVAPGGSLSVSWQIRNNGTGTAGTSNSQVRITTSNAANGYGTSANNVGSPQATGSIGPGATINQSTTVTVPSTAGTYYVWIVADNNSALTQTNTSNDYAVSSAVTVTSGSGTVDVQPLNVVPGSSSVAPGGSLSVSWQIRNNGTGTAGTSNSQVRITTSNAANGYGTSANNVGSPQATGSIGPGATINQSTTVTVPSTAGTYYVWIVADNNSALTQTNTSNDYAVSSAVTVTSGSGTVDVQPLNVVPGSSSVAPGGSLSVSWQIRNNGTGTAGTSNSQVRITTSNAANGYGTSANNVGSPQATGSIGPGATINQSTTVTVPSTAGTYYVWIVADNNSALTQTNMSNDYAVSSAVTVTSGSGTVDVQPLNVVPGSSSVAPGGSLSVSWQIRNNGTGTAGTSNSQVRITTSNAANGYGTSANNVGSPQATGSIGPGATINQSTTVTVPSTAGTYYVWIVADNNSALTQTNTSNDYAVSSAVTVTSGSGTVDVQPLNVVPGSSSVAPGGSLSVSWQIRNNGTGTAGTSNSQVRITTSNAANGYGTSANNVGSPQATGSIGPGATINQSTTVTVPSTAGTYYVWIVADNNSALTQTNTSNDYAVSSAVTVTPATILQFTSITPSSVSSGTAPFSTPLSLTGANFGNVNRISFAWSGATSGSAEWNRGDSNWNIKVGNITATSMTITPNLIAIGDPPGATNWTITLRDSANSLAGRPLSVTFMPGAQATQTQYLAPVPTTTQPAGAVTFSARVTSATGTPSGTVRFSASAGTPSCSAALSAGNATCTLTLAEAGTFSMTASYLGGGGFAPSTSAAQSYTVNNPSTNTPPMLNYAPATNTVVSITANETQIAVQPSGGSGAGPNATTTVGQCLIGGTGFFINAPSPNASLSFVSGQTAAQAIRIGCTRGSVARTAPLSCVQTRPTFGTVNLEWLVLCPATTSGSAPVLTYAPPTGSALNFVPAVPEVGGKAQASLHVSQSEGAGAGTGNTTVLDGCSFVGIHAGRFRVRPPTALVFNASTNPQSLNVECDVQSTPSVSTTLTCQELRNGVQTIRSWTGLVCPAGQFMPVGITTYPPADSPIRFTRSSSNIPEVQILSVYSANAHGISCSTTAGFRVTPLTPLVPRTFTSVRVEAPVGVTANGTLTCTPFLGNPSTWPLQFNSTQTIELKPPGGGPERLTGVAAGATSIKVRVHTTQSAIPTGSLSDEGAGSQLSSLGTLGNFTRIVDAGGFTGFEANYTPPARHRGTQVATIRINVALESSTVSSTVRVYASPVLLIHGLWADAGSFGAMKVSLQGDYPAPPSGIVAANYDNWKVWIDPAVRGQIENQRVNAHNQMRAGGIWADRFVLIGHSMGGLVSADVARREAGKYLSRLTLNTPRQGTHLATLLKDKQYTPSIPCAGVDSLFGASIALVVGCVTPFGSVTLDGMLTVPNFLGHLRIGTAVSGLIPASEEMKCLDGTGPCDSAGSSGSMWPSAEAIDGRLPNDPPHGDGADSKLRRLVALLDIAEGIAANERYCRPATGSNFDLKYCISRAITGSRTASYEVHHDGLVNSTSQSFQAPASRVIDNLPHMGAAANGGVISVVRCWLGEGSVSSCVVPASTSARTSTAGLLTEFLALPLATMTKIPGPTVRASRDFNSDGVDIQPPTGCELTKAYTLIGDEITADSSAPFESELPLGTLGRINARVVGLCSGEQYFDSQLEIDITPPVISSLMIVPSELTLISGSGDAVRVEGLVNGANYDFTRFVTFSTSDPLIARVSQSGTVSTDGSGFATVTAGLYGLTASGSISVVETEGDEISRSGFESGEIGFSLGRVSIGGNVIGLSGASGVVLSVNGSQPITVTQDGLFQFEGLFSVGEEYDVRVSAHPVGKTCTVSNGAGLVGSGGVSNVSVTCTSSAAFFTVGGIISGNGSVPVGLRLSIDGQAQSTADFSGPSFTFSDQLPAGASWNVYVATSPSGSACQVANGIGTIGTANVTDIVITCQAAVTLLADDFNRPDSVISGWLERNEVVSFIPPNIGIGRFDIHENALAFHYEFHPSAVPFNAPFGRPAGHRSLSRSLTSSEPVRVTARFFPHGDTRAAHVLALFRATAGFTSTGGTVPTDMPNEGFGLLLSKSGASSTNSSISLLRFNGTATPVTLASQSTSAQFSAGSFDVEFGRTMSGGLSAKVSSGAALAVLCVSAASGIGLPDSFGIFDLEGGVSYDTTPNPAVYRLKFDDVIVSATDSAVSCP